MSLINCWAYFSKEWWLQFLANSKKGPMNCSPLPFKKKFKSHFKDVFTVKPQRAPEQRQMASSNSEGVTEETVVGLR